MKENLRKDQRTYSGRSKISLTRRASVPCIELKSIRERERKKMLHVRRKIRVGWVFGNYWFEIDVIRDPIFIVSVFVHLFGSHNIQKKREP